VDLGEKISRSTDKISRSSMTEQIQKAAFRRLG
jgi:hypothetical protein